MQEAIVASDICKSYGSQNVLSSLSLSVERGQTYGFLGPNGAGKSTTIRILLGLVRPRSGSARLLGHNVQSERLKALAAVGALVESPSFYGYLTARENLRVFGRMSGSVSEGEIDEALVTVGLFDRADSKVKTYSHGMRQRLGIASALVPRPELVILDEPTNGMDPEAVKHIRELMRSLAVRHNVTLFLSSHLLHEVEQVCTHVGIISKGRLVAQGAVAEMLVRKSGPVEFEIDRPEEASRDLAGDLNLHALWTSESRFAVDIKHSDAAELNSYLVRRGYRVSAIERRQTTLEELYMDLMRKDGQPS